MSDFVSLNIALPECFQHQRHLASIGEIICSWLWLGWPFHSQQQLLPFSQLFWNTALNMIQHHTEAWSSSCHILVLQQHFVLIVLTLYHHHSHYHFKFFSQGPLPLSVLGLFASSTLSSRWSLSLPLTSAGSNVAFPSSLNMLSVLL